MERSSLVAAAAAAAAAAATVSPARSSTSCSHQALTLNNDLISIAVSHCTAAFHAAYGLALAVSSLKPKKYRMVFMKRVSIVNE
jgi:hypothetical protein